jgi:hypothetical protein
MNQDLLQLGTNFFGRKFLQCLGRSQIVQNLDAFLFIYCIQFSFEVPLYPHDSIFFRISYMWAIK